MYFVIHDYTRHQILHTMGPWPRGQDMVYTWIVNFILGLNLWNPRYYKLFFLNGFAWLSTGIFALFVFLLFWWFCTIHIHGMQSAAHMKLVPLPPPPPTILCTSVRLGGPIWWSASFASHCCVSSWLFDGWLCIRY